jgi:2,3-dihydroxybenzoate decarboxylase
LASPEIGKRLLDLGDLRLKEMDECGIDLQVLSHGAPSTQRMDGETAVRLARRANDRLAETCRARPDRFAAFAALPTPDPKAAADELERAVTKLGFKGAMVHGLTNPLYSWRRDRCESIPARRRVRRVWRWRRLALG